mgnify:FL=1
MTELISETEDLILGHDSANGFVEISALKSDYESYLNMSYDELDDLTRDECIRIQYVLTQYSIFTNKKLNALKIKLKINTSLFNQALMEVYNSYNEFLGLKNIII